MEASGYYRQAGSYSEKRLQVGLAIFSRVSWIVWVLGFVPGLSQCEPLRVRAGPHTHHCVVREIEARGRR